MSPRCYALLGSGEFEPWSEEVDRLLLDRTRDHGAPVLILPTASAAEGDDVFDRWGAKGLDHFRALGVPAQVLPLKTRADAYRMDMMEAVRSARVAYFSGGNPAHLARALIGTPFWSALVEELDRGLAYAGCSAGVACLGEMAPDNTEPGLSDRAWTSALRLFPGTLFGPHWDMLDTYVPGAREWFLAQVPDGWWLVGIDENTAMVGDGETWQVVGMGSVSLFNGGEAAGTHRSGATFAFDPAGTSALPGSLA